MALVFISEEGDRSRLEILQSETYTLTVDVYEDDQPVALDASATKIQFQASGGSDLQAKTATGVTVGAGEDGSTANRISYTLTTTHTGTIDESNVFTFFAVRDGETQEHERRVILDIVKSRLYNVVREENLFEYAPGLRTERAEYVEGVADASGGSTSTLLDAQLQRYADDEFNGGVIEFLNGSDEGEERTVTDFARSTGTVTFSPVISAAPDGDQYRLRRSWAHLIELAYEEVKWRVRSRGNRPALIIDAGELFLPILYHSLQLCYEAISSARGESIDEGASAGDGANWARAVQYKEKYDEAFNAIPFAYDTDDDAIPDGELVFGVIRAQRR
jgi:hypothetical protein